MITFLHQPLATLRRGAIGVIITTCVSTACITTSNAQATTEPVPATMHKLAADVQVLLPLIYQYDKPTSAADKAVISQQIGHMLEHVSKVAGNVAPRADTYQISYQTLVQQLQQAQLAFNNGRDRHGINLLRSATSVCATCHTQDDRAVNWLTPAAEALQDPFVAGEYFFMTRQYDRAFAAYQTHLRQQPALVYDDRTLAAFDRLLLTSLQIQKSPQAITDLLSEFTRGEHINGALKKDLTDWISGIGELQKLTNISEHPKPDTVKAMATQWLGAGKNEPMGRIFMPETRRPQIVWLRGELYRTLINEKDHNKIADWLYWLALSDRVLEYRFYYSLADMYLKQCMLEYTDSPIAKSCYQEYENYIVFSYSGSGGTDIPPAIDQELEMLKAKVFKTKPAAGK